MNQKYRLEGLVITEKEDVIEFKYKKATANVEKEKRKDFLQTSIYTKGMTQRDIPTTPDVFNDDYYEKNILGIKMMLIASKYF